MTNSDSFNKLSELIMKSNGNDIPLPDGNELSFQLIKKYQLKDIEQFELESNVKLPEEYKEFLQTVGACDCFFDCTGLGIKFLPLEGLRNYWEEHYDDYLEEEPDLIVVMENTRLDDAGAFIKGKKSLFTVIPHDEYLLDWIEDDCNWLPFSDWLDRKLDQFQ